jgi:hypothetical protein
MSARYSVRVLLPGTESVAAEFPCATLSDAAHTMLGLADTVTDEALYDDLGELTVRVYGAPDRPISEAESYHLAAIIQEHGGRTPDESEAEAYRAANPRRRA